MEKDKVSTFINMVGGEHPFLRNIDSIINSCHGDIDYYYRILTRIARRNYENIDEIYKILLLLATNRLYLEKLRKKLSIIYRNPDVFPVVRRGVITVYENGLPVSRSTILDILYELRNGEKVTDGIWFLAKHLYNRVGEYLRLYIRELYLRVFISGSNVIVVKSSSTRRKVIRLFGNYSNTDISSLVKTIAEYSFKKPILKEKLYETLLSSLKENTGKLVYVLMDTLFSTPTVRYGVYRGYYYLVENTGVIHAVSRKPDEVLEKLRQLLVSRGIREDAIRGHGF